MTKADERQWHLTEAKEVMQSLSTTETGLSYDEAKSRQKKYGMNKIAEEKKISPLEIFLLQFKNAIILILLIAIAISASFGHILDAIVIFIAVIVCALLGFFFEFKSEKAVEALKKIAAPTATVIRGGEEQEIPSAEIVPGDILVLSTGDRVAADVRLIHEANLNVDESPLTGESFSVKKHVSTLTEDVIVAERKNMVYAGTTVTYGRGKGVVVSTGMVTELGKIAGMLSEEKEEETPLKKRTEEIGKWLSIFYLFICATVFVIGLLRGYPIIDPTKGILLWSVSLAVAIVPESLPIIITGTLSIGMQRMAKKKAITRKLSAVETLGCVTVICSDKTGTLTKNEMTVSRIYAGWRKIEVISAGYEPKGEFLEGDNEIDPKKDEFLRKICQVAMLCNDSRIIRKEGEKYTTGDPTEVALVVVAEKAGLNKEEMEKRYKRIAEIPFEEKRKRMTTVHVVENKKMAYVKGAPEAVLELSTHVYRGEGVIEELKEKERNMILEMDNKMATGALRAIAVAYRELEGNEEYIAEIIEKDLVFVGLLGMTDPLREEVKEAIKECNKAGIKPIMITGDHKLTAMAIAKKLGLIASDFGEGGKMVLTGAELEKMSEEDLIKVVDNVVVYARVSPEHKLRIVNTLKKKGHMVAMTGDGINDAPTLKRSDIGIAMNSGTDIAKEASNMILTDNNFATIVSAVKEGRSIYENMRKYLTYVLSYNFAEIGLLVGSFFFGLPFPLIAIQILWANIVIEDLPAMGLGIEPVVADIMDRKPRDPKEGVFTKRMLLLLMLMSLVMFFGCIWIFFKYIGGYEIVEEEALKKAQTMVFATFISYEMINAFNCRSERDSLLKIGFLSNKFLILGVISSILLMLVAIQVPYTGKFFHTVPLTSYDWGIVIATSITIFFAVEAWKVLRGLLSLEKAQGLGA